jgi:hypothetical protein
MNEVNYLRFLALFVRLTIFAYILKIFEISFLWSVKANLIFNYLSSREVVCEVAIRRSNNTIICHPTTTTTTNFAARNQKISLHTPRVC